MLAPELWDRICSLTSEEYKGRTALVALAQTSRSLHEVATRYIWRDIPTIQPLLECLPDDVWGPPCVTTKRILRDIQPPDLERLRKHSSLVRSYGRWQEGRYRWPKPTPDVDVEIYRKLSCLIMASGQDLFPNIRRIVLSPWKNPETAACTQKFLGDRLCQLHGVVPNLEVESSALQVPQPLNDCRVIAKILSNCSRQLELALAPSVHIHIVKALPEGFCSFASSLRGLGTGPITPEDLAHIATLPSLEVLNINMGRNEKIDQFLANEIARIEGQTYFPSLRKLDISCEGTSACLSLIKLLGPNIPLVRAKFECINARSAGFKQLISLFSERCDPATLTELNIGDRYTWHDWLEGEDESFHSEHFEPILKFKNLKRLDMDIYGAFLLNDMLVEKMARSWPKIRTLRLYSDEAEADRGVTLQGIQALAKHCPELDSLAMYFDARLPVGGPSKLKEPSTCKLDKLKVIWSPIKGADPEMVASSLRDSFPHLTRFSQWDDGDCAAFYGWDDVQNILKLEEGGV